MGTEIDTVVDAFSGIGLTSLLFAKAGKSVISVEISEEAVAEAERLAKQNGLQEKIECLCGDCNEILPDLDLSQEVAVFVDPPRKGCGNGTLDAIRRMRPKRILYLSCNPFSLAEDLKDWKEYQPIFVQPYDMFPQTKHVETLVCLERK